MYLTGTTIFALKTEACIKTIFCCNQHYATKVVNTVELVLNQKHYVRVPESDDACIGHSIRETQDATTHDGIHQIKGRRPEGCTFSLSTL